MWGETARVTSRLVQTRLLSRLLARVLGSLLLFYLISGPPTFLEAETMAPGDTLFHRFTWSRLWCGCLRFRNTANHSAADVALFRLPSGAARNMSLGPGPSYSVQQNVTGAASSRLAHTAFFSSFFFLFFFRCFWSGASSLTSLFSPARSVSRV